MGLKEELFKELGAEFVFSGMNFSEKEARAIIFGVPFDGTTCFKPGARFGPNALREASLYQNTYSEFSGREFFENCKTFDIGNIDCMHKTAEQVSEAVERVVSKILEAGKIPVIIGGEHSITYSAIKAVAGKEKELLVLHFDAHLDLLNAKNNLHHGNFLSKLLQEGTIKAENVLQLGQRSFSKEELEFAKEKKLKMISAMEVKQNLEKTKKEIQKITKNKLAYITFDLDCLEASLVPAVGTPEPGGLSFEQAIEVLKSIKGKVIGLDLVETASDSEMLTQTIAAKLLFECLAGLDFNGV